MIAFDIVNKPISFTCVWELFIQTISVPATKFCVLLTMSIPSEPGSVLRLKKALPVLLNFNLSIPLVFKIRSLLSVVPRKSVLGVVPVFPVVFQDWAKTFVNVES